MTVEIAKSPKISHFLNLHDSSVGCHVDAASRKSVEIQGELDINFDDVMYKPAITP